MVILGILFLFVTHIILTCGVVSDIKNYNNWFPVPPYLAISAVLITIYVEFFKLIF